MLYEIHKSHKSVSACLARGRIALFWLGMSAAITNYVGVCRAGQTNRRTNRKNRWQHFLRGCETRQDNFAFHPTLNIRPQFASPPNIATSVKGSKGTGYISYWSALFCAYTCACIHFYYQYYYEFGF